MRQLQTTVNFNYRLLSRLHMDLNIMPRLYKGQLYILFIIDGVINNLITVQIHQLRSQEMGNALIENVISKYCVLNYIIMEQDSAFMSSLMNYLLKKLDIKIKTLAPYNHQLLQAEHGIKIIIYNFDQTFNRSRSYVAKIFASNNSGNITLSIPPNLAKYSSFQLVFSRKPTLLLDLETNPDIKVLGTFKDNYTLLNKILQYLHKLLQDFRSQRLAMINKARNFFQYNCRDLVYIISLLTSQLRTSFRKLAIKYVGPLVVYKIIDTHY